MKTILFSLAFLSAAACTSVPSTPKPLENPKASVPASKDTWRLAVGVGKTCDLPFDLGSIHLSDPLVLNYFRVQSPPEKHHVLLLIPRRSGTADLELYDADGTLQRKIFITVIDEPIAVGDVVHRQKADEIAQG